MEEELIRNMEYLKPQEQRNEVCTYTFVDVYSNRLYLYDVM